MAGIDLVRLLLAAHDATETAFLNACPCPALVEIPRAALAHVGDWAALAEAPALRVHLLAMGAPARPGGVDSAWESMLAATPSGWAVDAGSLSPLLDGEPLPAGRHTLHDGQCLSMADVHYVFLEPKSLFLLMGEVMRGGRPQCALHA